MYRSRAKKRDANELDIVKALKGVGASVYLMDGCGAGFPDLLVGYAGKNFLIEVKNPGGHNIRTTKALHEERGGLDEDQHDWHQKHNGQVATVTTPEQALKTIGAVR